jgi:hypothetical protein
VVHDREGQTPRGDVVMVANVAVEPIARREAVAAGLAVEGSPVVADLRALHVVTPHVVAPHVPGSREPASTAVIPIAIVMPAMGVSVVIPSMGVSVVIPSMVVLVVMTVAILANGVAAAAFCGARAPILVIGRGGHGYRQQDGGQPHHGDRETRSVIDKRHGEPPLTFSPGFDARLPRKFTGASGSRKNRAENARKSLRREAI